MPELPEVETVARLIRPRVLERTIAGARVLWPRTLGGLATSEFERVVAGSRVAAVRRRAKFVVLDLERAGRPAGALLVHLRMTGRLQVVGADEPASEWLRVALALEGGERLEFLDVRKFGRMLYCEDPAERLAELGPEPLERGFTAERFRAALASKRRLLKPLLLDQAFVAGLGNIYVDESLFQAGLHPLTPSDRVPAERADALHAAIRSTLRAAIRREGSSFDTFYRTPEGRPGSYQHQFQVYGRDGKPCRRCGTTIAKLTVGQRGTHVCPNCQRRPRARKKLRATPSPGSRPSDRVFAP